MLRSAIRPVTRAFAPLVVRPTLYRTVVTKRYTQDHEWISYDDSTGQGTFGITNYAQKNLGDVVFVELPVVESQIAAGESIGNVESVKAVGEIYAPVSGQVQEVNEELADAPELINKDPEATGWLAKIQLSNPGEFDALLSEQAYDAHCKGAEDLKIASLLLRTLSKPIATKIKQRAKDHEGFKARTIRMAQFLHRAEMNLRVSLLGESPKHVRPLSESRAIESGANFLSEGFLFSVAATIIIGETYRSRASESKRRDQVRESLESHESEIEELRERLKETELRSDQETKRNQDLTNIVEQVVMIGLKGGFGENGLDKSSDWERHLRIGELARAFRTNGRVLRDNDEHDEEEVRRIAEGSDREDLIDSRHSETERTKDDESDPSSKGEDRTPNGSQPSKAEL
ncbi:glycine decarboxylase subunit H [Sporobolomyces koalae]|uniref:glycine decarboxylase subunit H n=1 Tax=Sporobolomyces koalae TaxID=500713 RepID=UPI00316BE0B6